MGEEEERERILISWGGEAHAAELHGPEAMQAKNFEKSAEHSMEI